MSKDIDEFVCLFKEGIKEMFSKNFYKQIPNLLTLSRGLSPLVVFPLLITGNVLGAIISIGAFSITDFLDGKIARKYGLYSKLGSQLDPICDKIFAFTTILPLVFTNVFPLVFMVLEAMISYIQLKSSSKGNTPKTAQIGRIKTVSLFSTTVIGYISLLFNSLNIPFYIFSVITAILQGMTIEKYLKTDKQKDVLKEIPNIEKPILNEEENISQRRKVIDYLKYYRRSLVDCEIPHEKENNKQKVLKKFD